MVTAIIFDFFGVIRTDALKSWLSRHGYKMDAEMTNIVKQHDYGTLNDEQFIAELGRITGQPPQTIFADMESGASLDYHVLALIAKLHSRYKIGLLSNASSAFLRGLLHDYKLDQYFDTVVVSSEVDMIKPEPAIFKHTLAQLGTEPHDTLFIDDNSANIAGAADIGMDGILYTDIDQLQTELIKRDVVFEADGSTR